MYYLVFIGVVHRKNISRQLLRYNSKAPQDQQNIYTEIGFPKFTLYLLLLFLQPTCALSLPWYRIVYCAMGKRVVILKYSAKKL